MNFQVERISFDGKADGSGGWSPSDDSDSDDTPEKIKKLVDSIAEIAKVISKGACDSDPETRKKYYANLKRNVESLRSAERYFPKTWGVIVVGYKDKTVGSNMWWGNDKGKLEAEVLETCQKRGLMGCKVVSSFSGECRYSALGNGRYGIGRNKAEAIQACLKAGGGSCDGHVAGGCDHGD